MSLPGPDDSVYRHNDVQKGGTVVHMLREQVGNQAFLAGINAYLTPTNSRMYDRRSETAMEDASDTKLEWFFDQWVYGIGSPKLDVRQAYNPRSKTLSINDSSDPEARKITPPAYRLPLELDIVTDKGTRARKGRDHKTAADL